MKLGIFCPLALCLTAMWPATIAASPALMDETPSKVWQCAVTQPGPGRRSQVATLYFFDTPIEVDRYSPETGLDRVAGINTIVEVTDGQGAVDEYTFGTFTRDYRAYAITMRFSARLSPSGPKLVIFPQPAIVTIIDRITGEMRAEGMEPGSSPLACEAVAGNFLAVARAYDQLMIDAAKAHRGTARR